MPVFDPDGCEVGSLTPITPDAPGWVTPDPDVDPVPLDPPLPIYDFPPVGVDPPATGCASYEFSFTVLESLPADTTAEVEVVETVDAAVCAFAYDVTIRVPPPPATGPDGAPGVSGPGGDVGPIGPPGPPGRCPPCADPPPLPVPSSSSAALDPIGCETDGCALVGDLAAVPGALLLDVRTPFCGAGCVPAPQFEAGVWHNAGFEQNYGGPILTSVMVLADPDTVYLYFRDGTVLTGFFVDGRAHAGTIGGCVFYVYAYDESTCETAPDGPTLTT